MGCSTETSIRHLNAYVHGHDAGWSVSFLQRGMCLGEEIVLGCKDKNPSAPRDELSGAELWKALGKSPIRKRFAHLHFWAVVFDGFSVIAFVGTPHA